ncbi:hypothetical protein BKD30_02020 [Tersicoccus phoenicis]|uniref:Uncharacterized protein n=1 Tax=Tersicoccus phoenicis TaxID=554083 RepID=A0A1R1LLD2_9MICC|nr:hypothetical protein [Tersicoccus phoenicis]OMH28304.1 hypothetical protein BKD30_02020 [Tersicoccus phoenicis]
MMALSRAGRRALLFLVPYVVTMALVPRLGLVLALLVGLTAFAALRFVLHATTGRDRTVGNSSHRG